MQELQIYSALTKPIYLLGAPKIITGCNLIIGAEMFLIFKAWWIIFFCVLIQGIGVWMGKNDPDFLDVFIRHLQQEDYYDV